MPPQPQRTQSWGVSSPCDGAAAGWEPPLSPSTGLSPRPGGRRRDPAAGWRHVPLVNKGLSLMKASSPQ